MWWKKVAQQLQQYTAAPTINPALFMPPVQQPENELDNLLELLTTPQAEVFLRNHPQQQYLLERYIDAENIDGIKKVIERINRHKEFDSDNPFDYSSESQKSFKSLNLNTFINFFSIYTDNYFGKILPDTIIYNQLKQKFNSPEVQDVLENVYKNPESFKNMMDKIAKELKQIEWQRRQDFGIKSKKNKDTENILSIKDIKNKLLNQNEKLSYKVDIIQKNLEYVISSALKDSELKQLLNDTILQYIDEKYTIRSRSRTLDQLINNNILTEETTKHIIDSLGETDPSGIAYSDLGVSLLKKSDGSTWEDYHKIFIRNNLKSKISANTLRGAYSCIVDLPEDEINMLTTLCADPDDTLINAHNFSKFTGFIANPNACSVASADTLLSNVSKLKVYDQYNISNTTCASILKRNTNNDEDEMMLRDKTLETLLRNHVNPDVVKSIYNELDIEIDNTDPEQVKALAAKVFGMGIELTMFRSLGCKEDDYIFDSSEKYPSGGYDYPWSYIKERGMARQTENDIYTEKTGFGVIYFSPLMSDAKVFQLAKSRQNSGGETFADFVPIQDLIEARCLLGVESFNYWQNYLDAKSEDKWVAGMEKEPPPKTLRESLERIFTLYTVKETMAPIPWASDRYQYETLTGNDPFYVGTNPRLNNIPRIGKSNHPHYRKA